MIEPSVQFEIESDSPLLIPFVNWCQDCDAECEGWMALGVSPKLIFACKACGSENTERMVVW